MTELRGDSWIEGRQCIVTILVFKSPTVTVLYQDNIQQPLQVSNIMESEFTTTEKPGKTFFHFLASAYSATGITGQPI